MLSDRLWFATLTMLISGGCQFVAGVADDHELATCSTGQKRCNGNTPQVCSDALVWHDSQDECSASGPLPVCSQGECVAIDSIAAGNSHTCIVLSDMTVKCWGLNVNGQLGDGTNTDHRAIPTAVSGLAHVKKVVLGGYEDGGHTCAVLDDATVACWGLNGNFQLGDGTKEARSTPVIVQNLDHVVDLALGQQHTCALLDTGTVHCWGWNIYGQAVPGQEQNATIRMPTQVPEIFDAIAISAAYLQTCALLADGTVSCWGQGLLSPQGTTMPPTAVPGLDSAQALQMGDYHGCVLRQNGVVACWGQNDCGQLGNGQVCGTKCRLAPNDLPCGEAQPVDVALPAQAVAVELGGRFSCAQLKGDPFGTTFCWGRDDYRQLGNPPSGNDAVPNPVEALEQTTKLAAATHHICATVTSGGVACWGSNDAGQLGRGGVSTVDGSELPGPVTWE